MTDSFSIEQSLFSYAEQLIDSPDDTDHIVSESEFNNNAKEADFVLAFWGIDRYEDFVQLALQYSAEPQGYQSLFRKNKFNQNPAQPLNPQERFKAAYQSGHLVQLHLAIQGGPEVSQASTALSRLETTWDQYYQSQVNGANHASMINKVLAATKVKPVRQEWKSWKNEEERQAAITQLSNAELRTLYACVVINEFFFGQKTSLRLKYKAGASMADALLRQSYDCNVISTLALHLLQKIDGLEEPGVLAIPGHVTLVFNTSAGEIYFNNGQSLLPPGQFNQRNRISKYHRKNEPILKPWQILAGVYHDLAYTLYRTWQQGKETNSEDPSQLERVKILVNQESLIVPEGLADTYDFMGIVFMEMGQPDLAIEQFKKAITMNPAYPDPYQDYAKALLMKIEMNPHDSQVAEWARQAREFLDKAQPLAWGG